MSRSQCVQNKRKELTMQVRSQERGNPTYCEKKQSNNYNAIREPRRQSAIAWKGEHHASARKKERIQLRMPEKSTSVDSEPNPPTSTTAPSYGSQLPLLSLSICMPAPELLFVSLKKHPENAPSVRPTKACPPSRNKAQQS